MGHQTRGNWKTLERNLARLQGTLTPAELDTVFDWLDHAVESNDAFTRGLLELLLEGGLEIAGVNQAGEVTLRIAPAQRARLDERMHSDPVFRRDVARIAAMLGLVEGPSRPQ
jgi:hypothetical protein